MSKISDELRGFTNTYDLNSLQIYELKRIDAETVELPKDADGVTIHVGDTLDGYNETTVVKRLTLDDDGWFMTCENGFWFDFTAFTHHHEPTVEEVMQEMLEQAVGYSDAHTTVALNAIAEYSAKLRLAGDGEEQ